MLFYFLYLFFINLYCTLENKYDDDDDVFSSFFSEPIHISTVCFRYIYLHIINIILVVFLTITIEYNVRVIIRP